MRFAVIDIGTNSARYLLANADNSTISSIYADREITRLGKGLYTEERLMCRESMDATASAVARFASHAKQNNADKIICIATSAARDAANSHILSDLIMQKAGIQLTVLSGEQEALAGFTGALADTADASNTILVDIGGGSTEIIEQAPDGSVNCISYNCGCVRLCELFGEDYTKAYSFIKNTIHVPDNKSIVFIGGTASVLAMLYHGLSSYSEGKLHMTSVPYSDVVALRDKLCSMSQAQREELIHFDKKRADIVPYGFMIISYIMEQAGAHTVTTSEQGLMHGIIKSNFA